MKFQAHVEVSVEALGDAVCAGLECGDLATFRVVGYEEPPKLTYRIMEGATIKHVDYPCNEGGAVVLEVINEDGDKDQKRYRLDLPALWKGMQLLAEQRVEVFHRLAQQEGDALDGDALLQMALFGGVVYG